MSDFFKKIAFLGASGRGIPISCVDRGLLQMAEWMGLQAKKIDKKPLEILKGQMSLIEETAEVLRFLEIAGKNKIFTENAMHCRLSACSKLFSVLREGETSVDYILRNLSLVASRYERKNRKVTKNTLKVYKSRVKSSLEDYLSWCRDPLGWEQSFLNKEEKRVTKKTKMKKEQRAPKPAKKTGPPPLPAPRSESIHQSRKLSFPIRDGFEVELTIPADGLMAKELLKLQLFLHPFCRDTDDKMGVDPWGGGTPLSH